jgi:hypothetical protein
MNLEVVDCRTASWEKIVTATGQGLNLELSVYVTGILVDQH